MQTGGTAEAPHGPWTFGVLGPVLAVHDGAPIRLGGAKQRALLAFLILNANHAVSTRAIMRALWGDEPPPTAQKGIQVAVSKLRQEMGIEGKSVLLTTSSGYVLKAHPESIDVRRAEAAGADARNVLVTSPSTAAQLLRGALGLWRGSPMSDIAEEPFVAAATERINELRLALLDTRIVADLALSRDAEILSELRELCREHPLSERMHEHLALALYRTGRQVEALETLRVLRVRLAEELGLDPTPALPALEERMLRHDPDLKQPLESVSSVPATTEAEPRPQAAHPRRRWAFAGGSALALVVAVTLIVTLRGSSTPPGTRVDARVGSDSVAVLSGGGTKVVADVKVGTAPGAVAVTAHNIWVADKNDHTVTELDSSNYRVVRTYGLSDAPLSLTPLGDKVWIDNAFAGTLSRILVAGQELSAPFFPQKQVGGLLAIAATADGLWVGLADRTMIRLDPDSLRVTAKLTTRLRVLGIASSSKGLWTIPFAGSEVDEIDVAQRTSRTLAHISGHPNAIAAGDGSVWVTTGDPDALLRVDPASGKVSSFPLHHAATGLAAGSDAVWVAEGTAGVVERFPFRGGLHTEIDLGYSIGGIAVADNTAYLTFDGRL